jgi:hypothetical protein
MRALKARFRIFSAERASLTLINDKGGSTQKIRAFSAAAGKLSIGAVPLARIEVAPLVRQLVEPKTAAN